MFSLTTSWDFGELYEGPNLLNLFLTRLVQLITMID